ncbi:MAG: NAD(P)-dependent oxidoreductase [Acidimicrobiia bacterium]|nr:NAD(P)-dependent oxidoreductase [Acidimicrobiia bacterium]
MKPRVVVVPHFRRMSEIFDEATLERLHIMADVVWGRDEPMPQEAFALAVRDATAVVFGTWHYGRTVLAESGPNLRHIFEVAGSLDHPDLDYRTCFQRGITVGGCAHAFGPAVAEMGLALALAAARLVAKGDAEFRRSEERWLHDGNVGAVTMWGKKIGFIGAGGLSVSLQAITEPFQVRYMAFDPWLDPTVLEQRGVAPADLSQVFTECDFIFVLAVPTPDNFELVSRELMELLAPHQTLVVLSRAHLVDFEAMTDLVLENRFRVGVDVFPTEPFAADHRIRNAANAVFSAHRAGAIPEALLEIGRMVVDDLEELLAGGTRLRMQYATAAFVDHFES